MMDHTELLANYRLHHVGVIFPTLDEAEQFTVRMGLVEDYRGFVEPWSCWCIFTVSSGGTVIELVVPESGPLARFNKGAGGIHHFAFEVESIEQATAWAEARDMRMIEPTPVKGAGDFWCNFLSPASTRGIQIEFVELFRSPA